MSKYKAYLPLEEKENFVKDLEFITGKAYIQGRIKQVYTVSNRLNRHIRNRIAEIASATHPIHLKVIRSIRTVLINDSNALKGMLIKLHRIMDDKYKN
jgi:hypothetical protein